MSTKLDTVIRNGEIATAAGLVSRCDLGIVNGMISQIGGQMEGHQEFDAKGKLLIPGGIDAHVHLSVPPGEEALGPSWVDDFRSGSAAALAGGITTLGNMTFPFPGETPLASLEREAAVARDQSIVDFFLHPVLSETSDTVLEDITKLLESGCNSIKIFTVTPFFDSQIYGYVKAIRHAAENGLITLIHCEDYALIKEATASLVQAGRTSLRHFPASRPVVSEVVATQRAVALAELLNAPIYVVHLSSARALDVCSDAQSRNIPVYVETRPLYLHLTSKQFEDEGGPKYVGQPPLREQTDVDALWTGIRQGVIHTVCTDHAPWSLAAKLAPDHNIENLRPGVANLQTMLPMLYSEGVRSGRITLSRFVEITSTNASKLFGLYPRKGSIAVGSDADLVIFDPNLTRVIDSSILESNSDYSAYEGWEVTGWPIVTLRRGEVVFRNNEVIGKPGSGQLVSRQASIPL